MIFRKSCLPPAIVVIANVLEYFNQLKKFGGIIEPKFTPLPAYATKLRLFSLGLGPNFGDEMIVMVMAS